MLTIPPALQAKLDSGVTTLARCWLITRNDGVTLGFTDHDEDIVLNGVTCRADAGLAASEARTQLGLAVTGTELSGALSADSLTEADLAAGRYDAAAVEAWLVDWSQPALKVKLRAGVIGEVRREGAAFTAELRGLAHRFGETRGRLYTKTCNADLGDARCTVNINTPALRGEGSVGSLRGASTFRTVGLAGFADGWFTGGRLTWSNGPNAGQAVEVKTHRIDADGVVIELWQAMPKPIESGHDFVIKAGCDKHFDTCRAKFDNAVNFRGFPHIPGNDFVVSYPVDGEPGHDGGSLQG
jgi:uncharacterized phage protein (TIGR02218 family)